MSVPPPVTRKLVSTTTITDPSGRTRTVEIYDSRSSYPIGSAVGEDVDRLATIFTIPSSRYYYLTRQGNPVPFLATNFLAAPTKTSQVQFGKDLSAWRNALPASDRLYNRQPGQDTAADAEIDAFALIGGQPLKPFRANPDYAGQLRDVLRANPQFGRLEVDTNFVQRLINYPVHPDADFFEASQLALTANNDQNARLLQQYLDFRGIITFNADNIRSLTTNEKFFYLTRFYGSPVEGNLDSLALSRELNQRAQNDVTRSMARKAIDRIELYRQYLQYFEAYFNEFNARPGSTEYRGLGAGTLDRFLSDPFAYLALVERPANLPLPLTLNTIRQIPNPTQQNLTDVLKKYADSEIEGLIGVIEANNRTDFIRMAVRRLTENQVFLMLPEEAELCRNRESVLGAEEFRDYETVFIGIGRLAEGLNCYDVVFDLIENFTFNTDSDGIISFLDPINTTQGRQREFTQNELEAIQKALINGRGGIEIDPEIIRRFEQYIVDARNQSSAGFQFVRQLRTFANGSPANRELIQNLFSSLFRGGMYMRQWKGPGRPYPLRRSETGYAAEVGSELERDISVNVYQERMIFLNAMERLPEDLRKIVWRLPLYSNMNGPIDNLNIPFKERYDQVATDRYCIRMASAPWSFTGAYYLKQVLGEDPPGYTINQVIEYTQ